MEKIWKCCLETTLCFYPGARRGEEAGFVVFHAKAQSYAKDAEGLGWLESLRPASCFFIDLIVLEEGRAYKLPVTLCALCETLRLCERKRVMDIPTFLMLLFCIIYALPLLMSVY